LAGPELPSLDRRDCRRPLSPSELTDTRGSRPLRAAPTMSVFTFKFQLDHPVDAATAKVFSDVLLALQDSMNRAAKEVLRANERTERLEQDNQELRASNATLHEENARLKSHVSGGGGGTTGQPHSLDVGGGSQRRTERETAESQTGNFEFKSSIRIHDLPVHSVKVDPRGETIATASWDSQVKLYNLNTQKVVRTLGEVQPEQEPLMGGLYAVAFAKTVPDVLGCTSCDKSIYLWRHTSGKLLQTLTGHSDEVNGIDFHSTQQVMCTASDDKKAIIWDFQEGIMLRTLDKHTKAVYGASFLGEENQYLVATCCFDQKCRVFDMRDKQVVALLQGHIDDVIGIDYSSPKQLLATGSDDGLVCTWDIRTWKLQQKMNTRDNRDEPSANEVKRVAFSPTGDSLAAACSSNKVIVYDIRSNGRERIALTGHTDCVFDVAWGTCPSSKSKILVSASHDNTCRYWREVIVV